MRAPLAALAVTLLAAGCSAGPAATGPTVAPVADSPPVRWMNDVCGALLPLGPATQAVPVIDRTDARATLQGLSGYFSTLVDAFDQAGKRLAAVGPSPVAGGDDAVRRVSDALGSSRAAVRDTKKAIDAVDVNDPAALAAELPAALAPLGQLSTLPNPTAGLGSPELASAASQAPNCRTFTAAGR